MSFKLVAGRIQPPRHTLTYGRKQDLYFQVREAFLIKLRKHLTRRRNAPRWNMIPFLSAHDLDEELHELVSFAFAVEEP